MADQPRWCHAQRDGDCDWWLCPQLRDGEPEATGRICPLPWEPYLVEDVAWGELEHGDTND